MKRLIFVVVLFLGFSQQALACSMLPFGFDKLQYDAVIEAIGNNENNMESIISIVKKHDFLFEVTMSSETGETVSVYELTDSGEMCPVLTASKLK